MTEEEKKAIEDLKDILKYWQTIVEIEDDVEREIEMNCYSEEMPFEQLKIALNLIEKLQKENEEKDKKILGRKFYEVDLNELLKENYIPKDKIREKIKALEEYIVKIEEETCGRCITIGEDMCIRYLKELLEEE